MKIFTRTLYIILILTIFSIVFAYEVIIKKTLENTLSNIIEKKTIIEEIDMEIK